jgi:hypothetical protein
MLRIDPADPIDRIDPADPILRIDPADPILRIDPADPVLSFDPADPREPSGTPAFPMATFSPASYPQAEAPGDPSFHERGEFGAASGTELSVLTGEVLHIGPLSGFAGLHSSLTGREPRLGDGRLE